MGETRFEADGTRLFAWEDGAGSTIVMLHGGMATHVAALPFVLPLADRFHIVAPDLRGSGKSVSGAPLSFDRLADDVAVLLDHLGCDRAIVGGLSGGSGVALRCAFRHPRRTAGLVLVRPVYAGADRGHTDEQRETFARMDAVASRALAEGVQVLRPLYASLPEDVREKALAMMEEFDAASVVATSRFIASGAQPFASAADLASIEAPTLLVRGEDALHPPEVSDLYATSIRNLAVAYPTADVPAEIAAFAERIA